MTRAPQAPRPLRRAAIVVLSAFATLFVLLVWNDLRDTWVSSGYEKYIVASLCVYWGMWALWPMTAWLLWTAASLFRQRRLWSGAITGLALSLFAALTWARFIEPNHLVVRETTLASQCGVRVALVSDIHMGLFMREADLRRLIERLNALPVDAVLVAGDWTYQPPRDLNRTFAPWAQLKHPSFAVLGNHDEEMPGPPVTLALREALIATGVKLIDGEEIPLGHCALMGAGDLYAGAAETDISHLRLDKPTQPVERRVMLTHNPDVVTRLPAGMASLVLAGHTHGGQMRVPYLTQRMLRRATRGAFDQGLYTFPDVRMFITPGVGFSILPMRFLVPPTIDVLAL
ncbi:MAG TPA: metallophosphoesterase [Rhizobacter sp.]|nr:metallophosphoesterase [Rhizobacter sp.]